MKKIILLTYCALFTLTVSGQQSVNQRQESINAQKQLQVAASSTEVTPKQKIVYPNFSLISSQFDVNHILLLKLRVVDSRYINSVREKTAQIRKQVAKISKTPNLVSLLAKMGNCPSDDLVRQELDRIISLLRNVETNIQNLLTIKNRLSQLLGIKMNLDNAHAQVDLIGLLQDISNSVVTEFEAIENRCSTVINKATNKKQVQKYINLRSLLEKYRLGIGDLDDSVKALVENCKNFGININIFYTSPRSASELIFGNGDNAQNTYASQDEEGLLDPQNEQISLIQDLGLQHLPNAYVQYNDGITKTENILRFQYVPQMLQLLQANLSVIDSNACTQFAQVFHSFGTESLSTQLSMIEELVHIYNDTVSDYNTTDQDIERISPISDDDIMSIKKSLLSAGFYAMLNNLQTVRNKKNSETIASAINNIKIKKSAFIDNPSLKIFNDALNTFKSIMNGLGKSANISQEVIKLSSAQFKNELQEAIQNLLSPNAQALVLYNQNSNTQLTRLSPANRNSFITNYDRPMQGLKDSEDQDNLRTNSRLSTNMPRMTASRSMRGF